MRGYMTSQILRTLSAWFVILITVFPATSHPPQQKREGVLKIEPVPNLIVQSGDLRGVSCAAFSSDGKFLFVGGLDGTGRIWEVATGRILRRIAGHWSPGINSQQSPTIDGAAFSTDNRRVLTTGDDDSARLWDTENGQELKVFRKYGITCAALSPDNRQVLLGDDEGNIAIQKVESREEQKRFHAHAGEVSSIAFIARGERVLTHGEDGTAALWETKTWRELKRFDAWGNRVSNNGHLPKKTDLDSRQNSITASAASLDGKYVLTCHENGVIRLWDSKTGRVKPFDKPAYAVTSITFSPDNRRAFTLSKRDSTVQVWEVRTGRQISQIAADRTIGIVISPDGSQVLAEGRQTELILMDAKALRNPRRLLKTADIISSMVISPEGKYIAIAQSNKKIYLWDLEAGRGLKRFEGKFPEITCMAFSPDGQYLITGSRSSVGLQTVQLWDVATRQELDHFAINHFEDEPDEVSSVAFSPDSQSFLTVSMGSYKHKVIATTRIWNIKTRPEKKSFIKAGMKCAAFSPDGRQVVIGGKHDSIDLWDIETERIIRTFKVPRVLNKPDDINNIPNIECVAFSHDGRYVLTGDSTGIVRLWDVKEGIGIFELKKNRAKVNQVAFSQTDELILAGFDDGTAQLWETRTGVDLTEFKGHTESINGVAFLAGRDYVVTGSDDDTIRVWNTSNGREICTLLTTNDNDWVVVAPDGRFDARNIERLPELHWVIPDDPMHTLPLEIYMRGYYEPRLLPRLLRGDEFKKITPLASLNRAQPVVEIPETQIEQHKDNPTLLSVTIKATEGGYKPQQGPACKSGIYDLRLFRDGQLVGYDPKSSANIQAYSQLGKQASFDDELKVWRSITQFQPDPKTGNTRTFTVRLPKNRDMTEVELSAYAFNDDRVKSETYRETYKLPQPLKASAKGAAYLITIGVAASQDPRWNLFYPANDARRLQKDLYERLSQQYDQVVRVPFVSDYGGVAKRFGDCIEKKPSREAIRTVLDLLAGRDVGARKELVPCADEIQKANPEDLVLFAFSGHGYGDGVGNYYLFPYDTGKLNENQQIGDKLPDELLNRLISSEELSAWMRDIDAGEFVMVLDACQSEAVTGAEFKPGPMGSRGLGQLAYDKGMRMIVATQADNQAVGAGALSHGLLTYALLEGLGGGVSMKEWFERAAERVPNLYEEKVSDEIKKQGRPQEPSVFDFARMNKDIVLRKGL